MSEVPVRELNQNTAGVLARVKRGEQIDITERGAVVARLVPASDHPLSQLLSSGKLHPATLVGPAPNATDALPRHVRAGEADPP
jgi:prevent-host-death family protein